MIDGLGRISYGILGLIYQGILVSMNSRWWNNWKLL